MTVNMLSVFIAGWPLICCLSLLLDGREYAVCLYCWVAVNMLSVLLLGGREYAVCLYCWMAVNMLPVFIPGWA